jgi:hypothetical protein
MWLIYRFLFQAYEKKTSPRWMYDLGRKKNFAQVRIVETLLLLVAY